MAPTKIAIVSVCFRQLTCPNRAAAVLVISGVVRPSRPSEPTFPKAYCVFSRFFGQCSHPFRGGRDGPRCWDGSELQIGIKARGLAGTWKMNIADFNQSHQNKHKKNLRWAILGGSEQTAAFRGKCRARNPIWSLKMDATHPEDDASQSVKKGYENSQSNSSLKKKKKLYVLQSFSKLIKLNVCGFNVNTCLI